MPTYLANDKFNSTLTSGYSTGQNVLYVSAVPDNVPTIVVLAKGTANETIFAVTGKTSNSLTGVSRLRGANVNLDATTPVTVLNNAEFVNQYATAVSSPETLKPLRYAEDGGSTDAYAVSLDPAPASYYAGLEVVFKANTTNTGAATLNVNSLGAKTIKKNADEDLSDGDIQATQVITVVYDGTNFQLIGSSAIVNPSGTPAQGDILYHNGTAWTRLGAGTSGHFLKTLGTGANPAWAAATNASPSVRLTKTAQSIANNDWTALTWETETYDTDTMHDTGSNTSRITFTTAGVYAITFAGMFASNTTGLRVGAFAFNGGQREVQDSIAATTNTCLNLSIVRKVASGDYVETHVYQNSGVSLNLEGNVSGEVIAQFAAQYLGPGA